MKRKMIPLLILLLLGLGGWFVWRYVQDVARPNQQLLQGLEEQESLLRELRPDLEALAGDAVPTPESADPTGKAAQPTGEAAPASAAHDPLAKLRACNPDTVAWLQVPGTRLDYPVVQAGDNEAYLRTGYDKQYNYVGCPFLDCRCEGGFRGFHSIVYAHYIPGRQEMFADVIRCKDSDFLLAHSEGLLLTADGLHRVRFFAYLTVSSTSFVYRTDILRKADREEYIDRLFAEAQYTLGPTAQELKAAGSGLRLLLLSTCSYEYEEARGVLVGIIE